MSDERIEMLLSRLAADEGTPGDWEAFAAHAATDLSLWRDLAEMQRDQMVLTSAVNTAAATADLVRLPEPARRGAAAGGRRLAFLARGWAWGWSGWAVAAGVAIVAMIRLTGTMEPPAGPETPAVAQDAGWTPVSEGPATPEEALQAYFQLGQAAGTVLGEMPTRVLLDTRPLPSGEGYELLYLRQFLERETVPDLYRLEGQTEQGDPTLVRYEHPARGAM